MCVRLVGAVLGGSAALSEAAWQAGLDLRLPPMMQGMGRVVFELAWGECACALATSPDGGERVVTFATQVLQGGARLQLLLFDEREGPGRFDGSPAEPLALCELAIRGIAALSEGRAAELVR